jgi:hypothetical protein
LHHRKTVRQQGIRDPQIEVRNVGADLAYGKIADVLQGQGCVAGKSSVLGGDLSSLVLKLPGRIGQDRPEAPALGRREQSAAASIITLPPYRWSLGRFGSPLAAKIG